MAEQGSDLRLLLCDGGQVERVPAERVGELPAKAWRRWQVSLLVDVAELVADDDESIWADCKGVGALVEGD